MILALGVLVELRTIEIYFAQFACRVPLGFVVEVRRLRVAALAARRHRERAHLVGEFDDGDKAVAAGAIPLLGAWIRARAKGGERTPHGGGECHRNARAYIVERLDD